MDAHPGNGINAVRSISANVLDDIIVLNAFTLPPLTTPLLDPFNPANGWKPGTATKYSESFKTKYFRAQSTRMNFFIKVALDRLAQLDPGEDAPFIAPLADNARLSQIDLSIHHSTLMPRKLLKNDGTIEARFPVVSVRPVQPLAGRRAGFRHDDVPHAQVLPQRACDSLERLVQRRGLLLEQQLDAVQPAADVGAAPGHDDGRALLHP